jgi:hypothetical protein
VSPSTPRPSAATPAVADADRALAAVAAAFRPDAAGALLARLAGSDAPLAAREAARLVALSRMERLAALAAALGGLRTPGGARERTDRERPAVRAALERLARGLPAPGVAPALARLRRERAG